MGLSVIQNILMLIKFIVHVPDSTFHGHTHRSLQFHSYLDAEKHSILKVNDVWLVRDRLEDNVCVWKYMKYKHFEDLIASQALYFIPIARLQEIDEPEGDQKEGVETETTNKVKDYLREKNLAIVRRLSGNKITYPEGMTWDGYNDYVKANEKQYDDRVYVNYFHINNNENMEMWRRSTHNIAIRSTYGNVITSLKSRCYIGINPVYYVTEEQLVHPFHGLDRYFIKRKKFESQNELRIILDLRLIKKDLLVDGSHVSVNLNTLINEVIVGPDNEEILIKVQKLLNENNLRINVVRSKFTQ